MPKTGANGEGMTAPSIASFSLIANIDDKGTSIHPVINITIRISGLPTRDYDRLKEDLKKVICEALPSNDAAISYYKGKMAENDALGHHPLPI